MPNDNIKYKILRFYSAEGKKPKQIQDGLTLKEAQAHCKDPSTRKAGVWFDGYTESGFFKS